MTGLAWTSAGGEILYIESIFTKGNGQLRTTGKLGDVMKESAQIAVSLVKSLYPDQAKRFKEHDLHIHVPEGSVPKDGPSAGVTMTTALSSLVSGVPFPADWAMTGEVSLRGTVTAIGGLPEKLLAAQRAGVKRVFIPEENLEDLRDVAEEVKKAIEIIPVREVTEVLKAGGLLPEKNADAADPQGTDPKEKGQEEEPGQSRKTPGRGPKTDAEADEKKDKPAPRGRKRKEPVSI